jgi:creatinine amidohydrolase
VLDEVALGPDRSVGCEVAILPWGATEPHNLHLPFGTDTFQAGAVAAEACRRAVARGADSMVLPAVPFGANAQQLATPLTINLNPSTQARVLADIVESLEHHGVGKLLILNGHGGNAFRQMVRELQPRTSVFISSTNWWTVRDPADYFEEPGDHAGELETSVMLHIRPDLVLPLDQAGAGRERRFRLKGLRDGVAWAPRDWAKVTADTGVGDPRRATAEKGARFFADVCDTLAAFIVELAAADVTDLYESAEPDESGERA